MARDVIAENPAEGAGQTLLDGAGFFGSNEKCGVLRRGKRARRTTSGSSSGGHDVGWCWLTGEGMEMKLKRGFLVVVKKIIGEQ